MNCKIYVLILLSSLNICLANSGSKFQLSQEEIDLISERVIERLQQKRNKQVVASQTKDQRWFHRAFNFDIRNSKKLLPPFLIFMLWWWDFKLTFSIFELHDIKEQLTRIANKL